MKTIFAAVVFFFSAMVSATSINTIVVFGDSLSDNGNLFEYMKRQLPLSPPYFEGRFTNGPIWVELLAESYFPKNTQAHLLDYAFGGAGVMEDDEDGDGYFTLAREIDSYLLSHNDKADANSLYVVWMGANNYLAIPNDAEKALYDVDQGMQHSLQHLVDKGAKHILVVNLPDLGKTPIAREFDAVELLTHLALQHNNILQKRIEDFKKSAPDVQWLFFDVNAMMTDMFDNPSRYGFTNTSDTCYEEMIEKPSKQSILKMVSTVMLSSKKDACDGFLFFDPVHPSALGHWHMAEQTKNLFANEGLEFRE